MPVATTPVGTVNYQTQGPDRLTRLISVNSLRCSKRWSLRDGQVICESYGGESHWVPTSLDVSTFERFCEALDASAWSNTGIIIRAALHDDHAPLPDSGFPRLLRGRNAPFRAEPRRWVALDFDRLILPPEVPADDLPYVAQWVAARLPDIWKEAACWYQFTSSHGMTADPRNIRIRLWFLLDEPVTDFALTTYWRRLDLGVDLSLFRAVQPHYVSAPYFDGVADPCGTDRTGRLEGSPRVQISQVISPTDREAQPIGGAVLAELPEGELVSRQQVAVTIERIRQETTSDSRHGHMLGAAIELRGIGCPIDIAAPELEAILRRQGRDPQTREIENAWQTACDMAAEGTIRTTNPPVAQQFPPAPAVPPPAPTPAAQQAQVAATDEFLGQVAEWSTNDHLNARLYRRLYHLNGSLLRTGQTDFEWKGTKWVALENDETLMARVIQATGMKATQCKQTVSSLRGIVGKENLVAPCWVSTKEPATRVISFANGMLDVDKWVLGDVAGAFTPNRPDLFNLVSCPYDYNPTATAPAFLRFLQSIFENDEAAKREVLKMMGYLLTADNRYQKMFVVGGVTNSGKSTLANLIQQLVGQEACATPSISSMSTNFGPQTLFGKSLAVVSEANNGGDQRAIPLGAVDLIKAITGGDRVQIDRKHKEPLSMKLPVRFLFACNHLPQFFDPSGAMARRIHLFWLSRSHLNNPDLHLGARLEAELSGIVNLALQGLRWLLVEDGKFIPMAAADEHLRNYKRQMAPASAFMEDCLEAAPDATISRRDLYFMYRAWAADSGRGTTTTDRLVAELAELMPGVREVRQGEERMLRGVRVSAAGTALRGGFRSV